MVNYRVIEVSFSGMLKEELYKEELYKGPSKEEAIKVFNQPQKLKFSHKRMYEGRKRLYPYEF